ncbi:hypothetical protein GGQ91_005072 [Methylobacterium fujisawaense]|uniref:Recombinase domain-containing protein n=1 Tax=Methylobacterium fujisawaense TaxID=107400 RepID=A0ABR6DIT2_9HYPH|nr:recombinase family protein [Methylobacterium fujisawaense]MBA9065650.1 hypothetical protein [Methylobacterium fujisawaense]
MTNQPTATLAQRLGAAANSAFAQQDAEAFRDIILNLEMEDIRSHRGIATTLNARGVTTPRGGLWHPTTVARLLRHLDLKRSNERLPVRRPDPFTPPLPPETQAPAGTRRRGRALRV